MSASIPLLVSPILFVLTALILLVWPAAAGWPALPGFVAMPYGVLATGLLLGLFFTQTRIGYINLFLAAALFLADHAAFVDVNPERCQAVICLAAIVAPCLAVAFYRADERGVATAYGGTRAATVLGVILAVFVLTAIPAFDAAMVSTGFAIFQPMSPLIRIPIVGFLALAVGAWALLRPRKGESPLLGPLMCLALPFIFMALNFQSDMWLPGQQRVVLVLFMTGAGGAMGWAVLESAWWHANMDELTELPARRRLKHHFRCLGSEYAVAVVDLDHFKSVNDKYGHVSGDQVLRFVASHLRRFPLGTAYRYGGEEFVVVCEGRPFEEVVAGLERLCESVAQASFILRSSDRPAKKPKKTAAAAPKARTIRVTISIGVARSGRRYASPPDVMEAADRALYRAKEAGRNRVVSAR